MNNINKLCSQLREIAAIINSFDSEAVQVSLINHVLEQLIIENRLDDRSSIHLPVKDSPETDDKSQAPKEMKMGATRVLSQILKSDYFDIRRSIGDIGKYAAENYGVVFLTSEISGVLLKLAREQRLTRFRNQTGGRFVYQRPQKD